MTGKQCGEGSRIPYFLLLTNGLLTYAGSRTLPSNLALEIGRQFFNNTLRENTVENELSAGISGEFLLADIIGR
jgi:hypothetical protein